MVVASVGSTQNLGGHLVVFIAACSRHRRADCNLVDILARPGDGRVVGWLAGGWTAQADVFAAYTTAHLQPSNARRFSVPRRTFFHYPGPPPSRAAVSRAAASPRAHYFPTMTFSAYALPPPPARTLHTASPPPARLLPFRWQLPALPQQHNIPFIRAALPHQRIPAHTYWRCAHQHAHRARCTHTRTTACAPFSVFYFYLPGKRLLALRPVWAGTCVRLCFIWVRLQVSCSTIVDNMPSLWAWTERGHVSGSFSLSEVNMPCHTMWRHGDKSSACLHIRRDLPTGSFSVSVPVGQPPPSHSLLFQPPPVSSVAGCDTFIVWLW